jgi:hypothetical protein
MRKGWAAAGTNRWVSSDVNRTEFNAVVVAIESTDNEHNRMTGTRCGV